MYVSTAFRFAFRSVPEWVVLPSLDARDAATDGVFMAVTRASDGAGVALIRVTRESEPDLEAHAARIERELHFSGRPTVAGSVGSFAGRRAHSVQIDGTVAGAPQRILATVFARAGYVFELMVTVPLAAAGRASDLLDGFVPLEGPIAPPTWFDRAPDRPGLGSRITQGRFESGTTGTVLTEEGGWRLLSDHSLAELDPFAEVGAVLPGNEIDVRVTTEHVPPADQPRYLRQRVLSLGDSGAPPEAVDPLELELNGGRTRFDGFRAGRIEFLVHTVCHDAFCATIAVSYPAAKSASCREQVRRAPPPVRFLTAPQRQALLGSLPESRESTRWYDASTAFRGTHFVAQDLGLSFEVNASHWSVVARTGAERFLQRVAPAGTSVHTRAVLTDMSTGLHVVVSTEALPTTMRPGAYHRQMLGAMQATATARTRHAGTAGSPVAISPFRLADATGQSGTLATTVRGTTGIRVAILGFHDDVASARPAIAAIIASLRLASPSDPAPGASENLFIDARRGFSVRVPPGATHGHTGTSDSAEVDGWTDTPHDMARFVTTLPHDPYPAPDDALEAFIVLRAVTAPGVLAAERSPATLGGQAAVRLRYEHHGATMLTWVMDTGHVTYAIDVIDPHAVTANTDVQWFDLLE